MKNLFKAICVALLIISCTSTKKIKETTTIEKTTVESKEKTKDSIVKVKEIKIIKNDSIVKIETTLPTVNEIEFDLDDYKDIEGDFKSTVKSGDTETTIEKKGSKIKITTKTSGQKSIETNVTKNEITESTKETKIKELEKTDKVDTSDIEKSKVKKVTRIPFKFYLIAFVILIIFFRKQIFTLLSNFFPALKLTKIFSVIMRLK